MPQGRHLAASREGAGPLPDHFCSPAAGAAGGVLAAGQVQRHRDARADDVGALAQRSSENEVVVIENEVVVILQQAEARSVGQHHRDQHHDLFPVLLP